jgi:hypothetical protein
MGPNSKDKVYAEAAVEVAMLCNKDREVFGVAYHYPCFISNPRLYYAQSYRW